MDPQQRILLETVYEAFESAGWTLDDVDGSQTSVHVGIMTDDYNLIQGRDPDTLGGHAATGISRSILANRLSYVFNLQGASLALDTACSSSLVALHMAVQGLHRGEATQAVVAGTNLLMDSSWYIMGSSMHMISPESRCRMWDKDASGYARGEGCAAVVVKTLSQAIRDNDHIECIIRGTGVNSDGQGNSNGITIPSPAAQTALIQQTYRDAGLDPVTDRCQYFECHGTGTQAGDPAEAQAIQDAFRDDSDPPINNTLYCGSIKTVIGHLEGCAGLAGLIKASLAIQSKAIPPNMHFNNLNPKIEPFYAGLEVPTALLPWPETGDGPRRASVNSFGFGGTNAHAILESYEPSITEVAPRSTPSGVGSGSIYQYDGAPVAPLVFSARSRLSLLDWLKELLSYLRVNESVDLGSLSNTLNSKRSVFRYRIAIPTVVDREDLMEKLEDQINIISTSMDGPLQPSPGSSSGEGASILGVFTGQGAQAARMGFSLLEGCESFRESIGDCEAALASIPDPPTWSLSEELAADTADSRVAEAQFSQPLCTAVQIALVDLLRVCGVRFHTVVGHSSGEIAAAYAAGLLTKRDAMGVSYYRGRVTNLARGDSGQPGAMLAASISFATAVGFCSEPQFNGRITVAASNSPSSVTLSGDKDAIAEMKEYLAAMQIQARALQVDTAYHSHHMRACAEPYLRRLKELGVTVQTPSADQKCRWYSSVRQNTDILEYPLGSELEGQYWIDNLTQPVLFSQAVSSAVEGNAAGFTAAIEVGPHGTLRGPINQTMKQSASTSSSMAYTACLSRGSDAVTTFLEALTTIWVLAPTSVKLSGWRSALGNNTPKPPIKGLPPYAWEHTQAHWRESRVAGNYRLGTCPPHDILGRLWNDTGSEQTWRNTLRLNEMPWLKEHVFQSQVLFPATGYISLAVDAAKMFVKNQSIKLVEVRDMTIPTALPVGEGDEVEILFTIRRRVSPKSVGVQIDSKSTIEAEFTCHSYPHNEQKADKNCEGLLIIYLGDPEPTDVAPTDISDVELTPCNVDRFYHAASEIGFQYEGAFRALESLNKCWGHAKAVASWSPEEPSMNITCTVHPAILDVAFQTGLSTILSTAERSMHSPYLPIGVKRAMIDPNWDFRTNVAIEAYMTSPTVGLGPRIETDINVRSSNGQTGFCEIQMEGVTFKAISEPQPSEDRNILAKTVWGHHAAHGLVYAPELADSDQLGSPSYTSEEHERVALFYLQRLSQSISAQEMDALPLHHQRLVRSINALVTRARENTDRVFLQPEWLNDSTEIITDLLKRDPSDVNMALLTSSADRTMSVLKGTFRGDSKESLYTSLYHQTAWGSTCTKAIAQLMAQISHTFPRTNILHLCGSSCETVSKILDLVDDAYGSYTCANASQEIVDGLRDEIGLAFAKEKRLSFEVLDPETRTSQQLFDVVIVTDMCRVRQDLSQSVQCLRKLLRPGGFLITMELTGMSLQPMAILGSLEGWWANGGLGVEAPGMKTGEWDDLLSNNGFSGIDCITHDQPGASMHGYSVFSAQAMDDRLEVVRNPLTSLHMITPTPIIFIGGETNRVSKLIRQGKSLLRGLASEVQVWSRFDRIDSSRIPPECSVINLQDLDKPLFSSPPSVNELKNLKEVLASAQNVLWVTSGRLVDDPYANIMVGIGRSLRHEHIHLNLQFLDFDQGEPWDIQTVMTQLLRLVFSNSSPDITDGILWVHEPEIVIKNSQMITPRVLLDPESNEVYNAARRPVVKSLGPSDEFEIVNDRVEASSKSTLAVGHSFENLEDRIEVEVELSVPLHANDETPRYLSLGRVKDGRRHEATGLALSYRESSLVTIDGGYCGFSSPVLRDCDALTLVKVSTILLAFKLVSSLPSSGTTLICGAPDGLRRAISALAAEDARKVVFIAITHKPQRGSSPECVSIHPQSSIRAMRKKLPDDAVALFDFSGTNAVSILPILSSGYRPQTLDLKSLTQEDVEDTLNIYDRYQGVLDPVSAPNILRLSELSQRGSGKCERLSVVTDWTRERPTSAIIHGLDPHALISPNKTYFLVGMASELGQSLAYFLVRSGARYIVLSSRNPKDNQNWLRDLRADGIDIRVVKMDVTDRAQVRDTVNHLRQTMPEIGGVSNAALVLEPAVFANLSAASIAKQMMPKIHGTVHLDEVFKDDRLDFFMCFGSLGTVFGNPGHAIYHAGNAFMMSLVANRKRRGLVGSILNFGMLVDVGYVARADRSAGSNVEEWLRTDGLIALSEADFHHVILQGIVAGQLDSPTNEVIMGVETYYDKGQVPRPRWVETPTLSHMVRPASEAAEGDAPSYGSPQSKLENANTVDDAAPLINELLSQKIKSMIHVSLDSIHPDEPFSRLGIDSINAIEIRKWLWERFRVEISMVKLLGRDSSAAIIRTIAAQYLTKRPGTQPNIPNKHGSAEKEEARVVDTQVIGKVAEITTRTTPNNEERATEINHARSSGDSKTSQSPSEITPGSSSISTPTPEPRLEIIRSERLSIAQAGLFYIDKFSDTRTALNLTTRWRINGPLDVERLARAFQQTVDRHEALRTCFFESSGDPEIQQHVTSTRDFSLTRVQSSVGTALDDVQAVFDRFKQYEYDVEAGETLQATLMRHNAEWHTMVVGFHNLVIDVVSISLILSDIAHLYQSQPWSRYPTPTSYLDYTHEQMEDVQKGRFDEDIEYWTKQLDPLPEALPLLPLAKVQTRQSSRAYGHHYSSRELSSSFVQTITKIGQAHGVAPMQFYLAAMQVLLSRLLNINDMVIGVLHTGRDPISKFRETVGHLASILPIRFKGLLDKTFPEIMTGSRKSLLDSLSHASIPFALIVEKVRPGISEGNMPLIQVAYNYTVDDSLPSALGDCTIAVEEADFTTVYDFVLDVRRSTSGGHVVGITCTDDFYPESATHFILDTFIGVLDSLVQKPLTAVKDCRLFSNNQLEQARAIAHTPAIGHSWPGTLSERFAQVAAEFSDSVAIKDGAEAIKYSQLREKVELYASILLEAKITSKTRVAVFCKPSIDLYATMLAIFRIKAVFVPLDLSVPAARRNDMMKACKPDALVFHAATAKIVAENHLNPGSEITPLNITQLARVHRQDSITLPEQAPSDPGPDSHILFTSGSTGVPKGIKLHQRGIMNLAAILSERNGFRPFRVLQQTSIGFDVSFSQIYSAFANGGTLVVAPFESRGDPDMLSRLILDERVEFTMCTPSEYNLLLTYAPDRLRQCTDWRFAGAGGEVLTKRVVEGLRDLKLPHLKLSNWYGPTEVTVATSQDVPFYDVGNSRDHDKGKIGSNIGHTAPNNSIYITSEDDGSLLPIGMPGEICVAGVMVANGYLDPDQDEGLFVDSPFATPQDVQQGSAKMYKTGDRGYLQEDGSIIFLGRTKRGSTMIKLRGLRIDLKEVTGAILEAAPDHLADAAVTVRGEPQFLVCHVAFKPRKQLEHQQLMDLLQTLPLPRYMIPATIVVLDRLPMVPNGKLDLELLKSLPLPTSEASSAHTQIQVPALNGKTLTPMEERLRALWIDVIGVVADAADIEAHSSFLAVGGNSFLLVQLQYTITRVFGVKIPLSQLGQAADLRDMAALIEKTQ